MRVRGSGPREQAADGVAVEPRLDLAVGAEMVLEALERARSERRGSGHAVGGQVGQRRVVRLAVVHDDAVLAPDAQVFPGSAVGHGNEGDVRGCQRGGGLAESFDGRSVSCSSCGFAKDVTEDNLHPSAHVDITAGHSRRAEEDMTAIATGTGDLHRGAAAVRRARVEADAASLVAVGRVDCPLGLVPAALEAIRDLGGREGEETREGHQYSLEEHFFCRCWVVAVSE